jgi:hypothetical protein
MPKIGSTPANSMVPEVKSLYLPFLWLRRLKFYVENPVKAGLKAH